MSVKSRDMTIAAVTLIFSLFLAPNYSDIVGLFYLGMALAYMVVHISPALPQISISKEKMRFLSYILIAAVGGIFWLIGSQYAVMAVSGQSSSISEVLSLFASQSLVDLSSSSEFKLLTFGIHVPVVETLGFFGFIMAFVAIKAFKLQIRWQPKNWRMWFVAILMGVSFALFHLSAHDPAQLVQVNPACVQNCDLVRISNLSFAERVAQYNTAMVVDATFGTVSALVIFYTGMLLPALIMHLMLNIFVLVTQFGWV